MKQEIVPFAPTAGVVQAQEPDNETKVVPGGSVSIIHTFSAASGPLFSMAIAYVSVVPALTGLGKPTFRTARSELCA